MKPEDVPAEWVEKAARAIYEAAATQAYHDPEQTLDEGDWPEWDVEDPFFSDLLRDARHALAAVLPEALAQGWDEGVAYAREEAMTTYRDYKKIVGPEQVMASDTQPVFAAIDTAGTRFNYHSYNAHIHAAAAYGLADWLTVHPPIFDDDGTVLYEGDDDPNPHREEPA